MTQGNKGPEKISFRHFRRLFSFDSIDSTSEYLKNSAISPQSVAVSSFQTKGRGKHGALWVSQKGGLWFSYVLKDRLKQPYHYIIVSSVAVSMVLEQYGLKPEIKWPNDILVKGRKICGMLVEKDGYNKRVIVGIGINVNNPVPKGRGIRAVSMKTLGIKTDPRSLLLRILEETDRLLSVNPGKKVIQQWVKRQTDLKGRRITLRRGKKESCFTVTGVTRQGTMKVKDTAGRIRTLRGEIFFQ